jgi:GAF domain-containing protein
MARALADHLLRRIRASCRQLRALGPIALLSWRYRAIAGAGADASFCLVRRGNGPLELVWWDPPDTAWAPLGLRWAAGDPVPWWLDPVSLPTLERMVDAVDRSLSADGMLRTHRPGEGGRWWRCELAPLAPRRPRRRQVVMGWLRDVTAEKLRHDRAQAVRRTAVVALSNQDIGHIYRSVHRILADLMPLRDCTLLLADEPHRRLRVAYAEALDLPVGEEIAWRDAGTLRDVVTSVRPTLLTGDALVCASRDSPLLCAEDAKSWLAVPLADSHGLLGVAVLDTGPDGRPLDETDSDTALMVAVKLARVLRLRMAEEQRERYAEALGTLHELSLRISRPHAPDAVLQAVVDAARRLTSAERAVLSLLSEDGRRLIVRAVSGEGNVGEVKPASWGARGRAMASGEPYTVASYKTWPAHGPGPAVRDPGRVLAVPLRVGERVLGTLDISVPRMASPGNPTRSAW